MKKITAIIIILAMALTLAGCGHNTRFIMTVDGKNQPAGIYIMYQFVAAQEAKSLFNETYPDVVESEDEYDYEDYQLEGLDYTEWIKQKALELTARAFIIEDLFEKRGLSFDVYEQSSITEGIENSWNTDWYLEQLYSMFGEQALEWGGGGQTWGDFFSEAGVSKDSFTFFQTNDVKMSRVFDSFYGEDGTEPVPEEEWLEIFNSDYIRYRALTITTVDDEGEPLPDEEITALRDFRDILVKNIAEGGSFIQAQWDYNDFIDDEDEEADVEESSEEDDAEGEEGELSNENEIAEDDETEIESEYDSEYDDYDGDEDFNVYEELDKEQFDEYIKAADFSESEIMQFIMAMDIGVPDVHESETADYIIMRLEVLENEDAYENYKSTIISDMKSDEFSDMLEELAKEWLETIIVVNQVALEKYDPRRFMEMVG